MRLSFVLLASLLSFSAFADESTMLNAPTNGAMVPHRGAQGKNAKKGKKKNTDPQRLSGICEILESPSDPFAGPCVTMPIELVDASGKVEAVTRSSGDGRFEFEVDEGSSFSLKPSSSSYEVVQPTGAVSPGPKPVRMQIRRKAKL